MPLKSRHLLARAVPLIALLLGACKANDPVKIGPIDLTSDDVWHKMLPELAKGHADKISLAWYATSIFRHVDQPVKDLAHNMETEQKRLQARLQAWASAHHYDLKFHYGDDTPGKARAAMEDDDGKIIKGDGDPNFQHDMLIDMQSDYDWQRHLIAALLLQAKDPELKAYLEDSLKVHEQQYAQIRELLKRYQWK